MATILRYRDTGYNLIKGSAKVLFSNGVCLTASEYQVLDKTDGVVREILKRERDGETLYDFQVAVKEGVLREMPRQAQKFNSVQKLDGVKIDSMILNQPKLQSAVGSVNFMPKEQIIENIEEIKLIDTPKQKRKKRRKNKTKDERKLLPRWRVQVPAMVEFVMLLVAVGSAIMSAYHTSLFMMQNGHPLWSSVLTGVIMILFSATAFTAGRYFLQEKTTARGFGILFIILGSSIVSYSIFSTIAVNHERFQLKEKQTVTQTVEASTEAVVAKQQREALSIEIQRIDTEVQQLLQEAEGWRNQSWRRYDDYVRRIDALRERRNLLWSSYIETGETKLYAEGKVEAARITVYTFVASLLFIPEETLRFIIYTIPAVFYDIASPFGFTIILMLEEKRRKNNG